MTGIDYKHSELSVREKFAVSKESAKDIMAAFTALPYVGGCCIISTCNRTEVYATIKDISQFCVSRFLCGVLSLDYELYADRFIERGEEDTFYHLCSVASGIDSQILGDDQIITQVRESIEFSRSLGFTESYMETVFRIAIKAAKEIKTKITVRSESAASAPHKAIEKLKEKGGVLGKKAVVIGNGQMGRLAASLLLAENANVTVTLREYKYGKIPVPDGASTISYSERFKVIENSDIVVSATTSPHFTVKLRDFSALKAKPALIIDLAVPRDIDPEIGALDGVTVYTIDDLGDTGPVLSKEKISSAKEIIDENFRNYYKWREYKENNK